MSFSKAFERTSIFEGGYSNHPHDRGGETYKGIARNFHPYWSGWKIIDNNPNFKAFPELQFLVESFYKEKYWDSIKLDSICDIYNTIGIELFDISVNFGKRVAGKTIQRALNILNRDEKNYQDLKIDGFIGKQTFKILKTYSISNNEELIIKLIILLKAKYYIDIVESNKTQEIFIRGWLNRINLNNTKRI